VSRLILIQKQKVIKNGLGPIFLSFSKQKEYILARMKIKEHIPRIRRYQIENYSSSTELEFKRTNDQ
jgi:hypothetical protein